MIAGLHLLLIWSSWNGIANANHVLIVILQDDRYRSGGNNGALIQGFRFGPGRLRRRDFFDRSEDWHARGKRNHAG